MTNIKTDLENQVEELVQENYMKEQKLLKYESIASQLNVTLSEAEADQTLHQHLKQILSTTFYS